MQSNTERRIRRAALGVVRLERQLSSGRRLILRDAIARDTGRMAVRARVADRLEFLRHGQKPRMSFGGLLLEAWKHSAWAMTGEVDGEIAALWGLVKPTGQPFRIVGLPWLVTTPIVERNRSTFLRVSRVAVERMRRECPDGLYVDVDAEYAQAVRWIEWLGFQRLPAPIQPNPHPFHGYYMPGRS